MGGSGVAVSDDCIQKFSDIKKAKMYRYVVYHIADFKIIDVKSTGSRDATYEDFLAELENAGPDECRYGLYDFEYTHQCQGTSETMTKAKLVLILWCPDSARIKMKMAYSSSYDALKHALVGVHKYIQATDISEASESAVEGVLRATDRV